MEKQFIVELKKLIKKALKTDEVPVAALVVRDRFIIARAYNKKNQKNNAFFHAEILALYKAMKKLKSWRLSECDLYVTMKPCSMCEQIIKETRIKNVYYLVNNHNKTYNFTKYTQIKDDYSTEYLNILKSFFKSKR